MAAAASASACRRHEPARVSRQNAAVLRHHLARLRLQRALHFLREPLVAITRGNQILHYKSIMLLL